MILLHALFAIGIVAHQYYRLRRTGFDTLMFIAAGFVIAYGIFPVYLGVTDFDRVFSEHAMVFPFQNVLQFAQVMAPSALFHYIIAYILICFAYSSSKVKRVDLQGAQATRFFDRTALAIFVLGAMLLAYYIRALGGLEAYFRLSMYLRANVDTIFSLGIENIAFLKNLCGILLAAAILSATAIKINGLEKSPSMLVVFAGSVIGSFLVLIHKAGRLDLATFIFGFLVARILGMKRIPWTGIAVTVLAFATYATIGKELFWKYEMGANYVIERPSAGQVFHRMMMEVSFPHITTMAALYVTPDPIGYRYFSDLPIALVNLIPAAILKNKMETVIEVNTAVINTGSGIPVDLVAFGVYSAGSIGVILWALFYGKLAGFLDAQFSDRNRYFSVVRGFVAVTAGQRVLYSDPTHTMFFSLHVVVAVLVTLAFLLTIQGARRETAAKTEAPRIPGLLPSRARAQS